MYLDILVEPLLEIEKIIHGFLWKGRGDLHGGHYLWDRVCTPKEFGGLAIPNMDE
jgi:hypothetical protein